MKHKGCFQSLRKVMVEGVLSVELIAFWTEEANSEACLDFPVPAPPR